jgi:AcrR family transcriptional regulator
MSNTRGAVLPESFRTDKTQTGSARSESTVDPRAARTRQGILDAVMRLRSRSSGDLAVTDIVREAAISRSSFYAHFAGLDELAIELLRRDFASAAPVAASTKGATRESARASYVRLVEHFSTHQSIYSSALGLPLSRRAYDEVIASYAEQLMASFAPLAAESPDESTAVKPADVRARVAATYVAGGTVMLLGSWIAGELPLSKEELVDELVALLPPWLG